MPQNDGGRAGREGYVYTRCTACAQVVRFVVDTAHRPRLEGKVGVRCSRCGGQGIYEYKATPGDERERRRAGALEAGEALQLDARVLPDLGDEWQQVMLDEYGWERQPEYRDWEYYIPRPAETGEWARLRGEHAAEIAAQTETKEGGE